MPFLNEKERENDASAAILHWHWRFPHMHTAPFYSFICYIFWRFWHVFHKIRKGLGYTRRRWIKYGLRVTCALSASNIVLKLQWVTNARTEQQLCCQSSSSSPLSVLKVFGFSSFTYLRCGCMYIVALYDHVVFTNSHHYCLTWSDPRQQRGMQIRIFMMKMRRKTTYASAATKENEMLGSSHIIRCRKT